MAQHGRDQGGVLYRPLQPTDYTPLKLLHQRLFPVDYDDQFYLRAVQGLDGILSWAATVPLPALTQVHIGGADPGLAPQLLLPAWHQQQQDGQLPEQFGCGGNRKEDQPAEVLAGFITARAFPAFFADPNDRQLLGVGSTQLDGEQLLYVLTLGVAEPYRRLGVARRLLDLALRHAAQAACRAVYLHVADFNTAAIAFYKAAGFRQLSVVPDFYYIRQVADAWTGRQPDKGRTNYDACMFGLIVQQEPTPWHLVNLAVSPLTTVITSLNACMPWGLPRRPQCAAAVPGSSEEQPDPEAQLEQQPRPSASRAVALPHEPGGCPHEPGERHSQPLPPPHHGSSAGSRPPNWLRYLFTRR